MARILRRWRELTGGRATRDPDRRTLVACSAGADSVALAVAIAQVPASCVLAHIRHDIRDAATTERDLDCVESLAAHLGVVCDHARVRVRAMPGNLEANARDARYGALRELAAKHGCPYIATGHHADDQLETLLMHLMRGSGTRGMGGMQPVRPVDQKHTLVRPMLRFTRAEIESMLTALDIGWREDETNSDTDFVRNRIRHELLPVLRGLDPDIAIHGARWASDLSAMQELIDDQVRKDLLSERRVQENQWSWPRASLRHRPRILLGYLPGLYCREVLGDQGRDSIIRDAIESWIRSVKSDATDPTEHRIGPILSQVRAQRVIIEAAHAPQEPEGDTP